MSAKDHVDGWWDAPAGDVWTCPECGEASPIEEWQETEVGCEDCGTHDARKCPRCGEDQDHVWGSKRIARATSEGALAASTTD